MKQANNPLTRRQAIQAGMAAVGVGLALSGCSREGEAPGTKAMSGVKGAGEGRGTFFTVAELALLAQIVDIIIPATDTPGALAANVHGYIDNLMAECALDRTRVAQRALLSDLDGTAKGRFGAGFVNLSLQQRTELISTLDADAFKPRDSEEKNAHLESFVRLKEWVFWGYYHSEIGATQELQYQLVPGHYVSCAPLSSIGRTWVGDLGDNYFGSAISMKALNP